MQVFDPKNYINSLKLHYETYYGKVGRHLNLEYGAKEKLHPDFFILELPPNDKHSMFCYCSVGMSADRLDDNLIELVVYSPRPDNSIVELLTFCASYHRDKSPLNIHHTVNLGQPWLNNSPCDHGFISLPYLDGQDLEIFNFIDHIIHCYWFIPITERERDYKINEGCEALEQLFEKKQIDYLNPNRESLV